MTTRRWFVLAGLMLTYAVTNGILVHTLPLLYPYLIEQFGWTQSEVTRPAAVFLLLTAITSPPAGYLLDRYPATRIVVAGLAAVAAGLLGYSVITSLNDLVLVYVLFAIGLSMCGLVSNMLILSRWFAGNRGFATGLLLMASSAGGAVFPLLLGYLLEGLGWRAAMQAMAATVVLFALVPFVALVRDRPPSPVVDTSAPVVCSGPTLIEAISEGRFYLIAVATAAVWFSILGMVQHQSIYLAADVGIPKRELPALFSLFFAFSVVGKFLFGALGDIVNKKLMLIVSILTLTAGLVILRGIEAESTIALRAYAVVAGIGFSGAFTMIQLTFATYYAGSSFGLILALLMMIDTLSGAAGTYVIGRVREISGSYHAGIDLMIGLLVFAVVCLLAVRPAATTAQTMETAGGST